MLCSKSAKRTQWKLRSLKKTGNWLEKGLNQLGKLKIGLWTDGKRSCDLMSSDWTCSAVMGTSGSEQAGEVPTAQAGEQGYDGDQVEVQQHYGPQK